MAKRQRKARRRVLMSALALVLLQTAMASRVLAQLEVRVSTEAELRAAVVNDAARIHFVANVTMTQAFWPEILPSCWELTRSSLGYEHAVTQCQPGVVFYSRTDTTALWTSDPGVFVDFRYLRRGLSLLRPLTLRGMQVAGMMDDFYPNQFYFALFPGSRLTLEDTVVWSLCGGLGTAQERAAYMYNLFEGLLTGDVRIPPSDPSTIVFDSASGTLFDVSPPAKGDFLWLNLTAQCYVESAVPSFAGRPLPTNWIPGSENVQAREPGDPCQRKDTGGADYRGTVSVTRTGQTCQKWGLQTPQPHTRLPNRFPHRGIGESNEDSNNYCRNPDNEPGGVYCYTTDPRVRWNHCDVPICTSAEEAALLQGAALNAPTSGGGGSDNNNTGAIIAGAVVGGVLLFALAAAAAFFLVRRSRQDTKEAPKLDERELSLPLAAQESLSTASAAARAQRKPVVGQRDAGEQGRLLSMDNSAAESTPSTVTERIVSALDTNIAPKSSEPGTSTQQHSVPSTSRSGGASGGGREIASTSGGSSGADSRVRDMVAAAVASMQQELREGLQELEVRIFSVLGEGGFGIVYHGEWRNLEVAIKTVLFQASKASRTKLVATEAAIASSLNHRNVVATYTHDVQPASAISDIWKDTYRFYLIQEYCNGGSLRNAIDGSCFGVAWHTPAAFNMWSRAVGTLEQLADAMWYIHSKRICHGDLSPHNVLFKYNAADYTDVKAAFGSQHEANAVAVKVTDFGLSRRLHQDKTHASGIKQGTPFYMAPELTKGRRLGPPADVYSFGVIMWECLKGRPVYVKREIPLEGATPGASDEIQRYVEEEEDENEDNEAPPKRYEYTLHPDFPSLPSETPLSYTLLMKTCLSESIEDRLSFEQILTVLRDVAAEVVRGWYVDSTGQRQDVDVPSQFQPTPPLSSSSDADSSAASEPLSVRMVRSGPTKSLSTYLSIPQTIMEAANEDDPPSGRTSAR